ncbi:MAG TPA: YitT family protein [Ferruginibacter sp.]|nr:YitT family protein [Ferruginibacter sp.]
MTTKKINIFKALFSQKPTDSEATRYSNAKRIVEFKLETKKRVNDIFFICMGILSAGFGLKGFLLPNKFIDGGATGISLLIAELTHFNFPLLLIAINIPFIVLGYNIISRQFAIRTALGIIGVALCVAFMPYPQITNDKLLVAVFGGFFLGAGIGLAVRGGGVLDGTEVLAIAISKNSGLTIGDVILIINITIFSSAVLLLSVEVALYAMLTYLSAAKTVDFIIEGIEEYTAVTIISVKADKIQRMIPDKLGRGMTVYKGERGFGKSGEKMYDMKIIYTIVTRLEVNKLKLEIEKIDPNAFVVMSSIKDMKGGMIKKRRLE